MKSFSFLHYAKFLALASVVIFSFNACNKDDNNDKNDPEYLGTWSRTDNIPVDSFSLQVKDIFTFTKNTVTDLGRIYNPDTQEWLDLMGMKANFSVSGNNMNITVKEVGISDFDTIGVPSGDIVYFNDQQTEFNIILSEVDLEKNFDAEYNVMGNQLTLKTDDNGDGDFLDEGETQVYTKE